MVNENTIAGETNSQCKLMLYLSSKQQILPLEEITLRILVRLFRVIRCTMIVICGRLILV